MSEPFVPLSEKQIEMFRQGLINSEWCGFSKRPAVNAVCDMALASLSLPAPCGHPSQYVYSEDGGAHMVCLLCERATRTEALTPCPENMLPCDMGCKGGWCITLHGSPGTFPVPAASLRYPGCRYPNCECGEQCCCAPSGEKR